MNFSDPSKVADVIQRMQDSDEPRAINRTRINSHFNGNPPWTDDEAEELRVQYNVPFGEGPTIMDNARGQWETAFTAKDKYFSVRLSAGPPHKRIEWAMEITGLLAKIMKRDSEYTDTVNTIGAQLMLHGIGPVMWENQDRWCPYPVAIEDLKINSRTLTSFSNLAYFGVMRRYTPFELYRAALGEYADPNWNPKMVKQILAKLADVNSEQTDWTQYQFPERLEEDFKSNGGYWGSDAVPTINCWDFYHRDDKKDSKAFYRKIILDWDQPTLGGSENASSQAKSGFLYESKEPYADNWRHILHVTFANGAHVAPFRYHSVRGLGYRLYRQSITLDKMMNKMVESFFMEMLWIFKNVPAEDRERLEFVLLNNMGVLPQGASYVPAQERYKPDLPTIMANINQMRQLMSESSASYVSDSEGEGNARETATKTTARLQSANRLIGAFLSKSYTQMQFQDQEICRRFCRKNSEDPDVQEFWQECRDKGIPEEVLDLKYWDVTPEKVIANGDKLLGAILIDRLMAQYPRFGPDAQKLLLRIFAESSSDPDLATALVPLNEDQEASPTVVHAYDSIGTIMLGLPSPISKTDNLIESTETLLQAMAALTARIEKQNGMTDEKTVLGLFNLGQAIAQRIQLISQDQAEKPRVKVYEDALKRQMNMVKAYAQRLQQQAQKRGQQLSPEIMAKMQADMLTAQSNARIKEASNQQKMKHKEQGFWMEQRRRDQETQFDLARKAQEAQVDVAAADLKTEGEIRNGAKKMAAFEDKD